MIKRLQFFVSDTLNPYINLAKEKALLDLVDNETIILYLWQNQNTVVIGKNQNALSECRTELLKEENGTLARRLSGGGAVFHDLGNLNFTFICSTENFDVLKNMQVIQKACQKAGIETELSGRNDVLANGKKFSGNAFYNNKGRSYHHGTILINADTYKLGRYLTPPKAKLQAKGVKSVKSRVINLSELSPKLTCESMKGYLLTAFEETFNLKATPFCELDSNKIEELSSLYSSWEFLYGTPLPFNVECNGRLSFGSVDIKIDVKNGIVQSIKFYTDALDSELSKKIESALISKPFTLIDFENSLISVLEKTWAEELLNLLKEQVF